MFKGKKVAELKIPTLEEASERFAALKAREAELDQRRASLQSQIGTICEEERKRQTIRSPEVDRERLAAAEAKARRAGALIGDLMQNAPRSHAAPTASATERLLPLEDELADVKEALRLLKIEIAEETKSASRVVCDAVRPEHDRRAEAVAAAFAAFLDAAREYQDLAGKLNKRRIQWARLGALPLETSVGVIGRRFSQHMVPLVNVMTKRGDLDLSKVKD